MAIQRSIIIKSTDAFGNAYEKKFGNINPAATNANLDTFARAIQGLSSNTYVDTMRVDSESINEAIAEED